MAKIKMKNKMFKKSVTMYIIGMILIIISISFTIARNTNINTINNTARAAKFHVSISGLHDDTINCKIRATSKVTDIDEENGVYIGNSFISGAYVEYPVVIKSDSDVKTNISFNIERLNNDDRIFYIMLPDCESDQDIYEIFYNAFSGQNVTLSDIRNFCDDYNSRTYELDFDEERRFTFIIWSEHDSVFIDSNNDGIVDTNDLVFGDTNKDGVIDALDTIPSTTYISDLVDGEPSEIFTINYSIVQDD